VKNFLPHSRQDIEAMCQAIGIHSLDALFEDIPSSLQQAISYNMLPHTGASEWELQQLQKQWAAKNTGSQLTSFLGAGAYHRFIPSAVATLAGRSEFYTAYTPYQPEVSQGTLQVTYEFQSMISELMGMDVANASVYDSATAVAEAALMALRITKRTHIWIANSVHPDARAVLETYIHANDLMSVEVISAQVPEGDLVTDSGKNLACVILQQPNFFGSLENIEAWATFCKKVGALLVVSMDPVMASILKPHGELGADIAAGSLQPLGNALSFGGPTGGFVATKTAYLRQLPGRIVGKTLEKNSEINGASPRPCFTLTLQTREQHIRREKATSNICTNQALNVLRAAVYLTLMGPAGLQHIASLSVKQAHQLEAALTRLPGVTRLFPNGPFGSEFALLLPVTVDGFLTHCEHHGILAGVPLKRFYPEYPNGLLISVTECHSSADLKRYVDIATCLLTGATVPTVQDAHTTALPLSLPSIPPETFSENVADPFAERAPQS
jgi:glycine dehydrogenase subunit 1